MAITVFEGYMVGPIEQGIPLPTRITRVLSMEQGLLLQLKVGEFLDVPVEGDGLSRLEVSRLMAWAKRKNIGVSQRNLAPDVIRIQRISNFSDAPNPG